jgi:uncharacterized protein YegL
MTDLVLPTLDVARLVRRQLHVLLALDCSGSMRGSKIASLNYAIRAAIPELRNAAAENPEVEVRLRALRFSSSVNWHIESPTPLDALDWSDLAADGETNMGEALAAMAGALTAEALPGRQLPPVIVLVSDGYPSDDVEAGLSALMSSYYGNRALRVAISIGSDADEEILERFIGHPSMRPLQANNAQDLARQIKWATTMPVRSTSSPTNAPDAIAALARNALQPGSSDLIW